MPVDQSMCDYQTLIQNHPNVAIKDIPNGARCFREYNGDISYCGTVGASCGSDQECDGGRCSTKSGKCRGGFGSGCTGNAGCSGQLSCGNDIENPMCGGEGAVCAAPETDVSLLSDLQKQHLNKLCASHCCDAASGQCKPTVPAWSPCGDGSCCEAGSHCAIAPETVLSKRTSDIPLLVCVPDHEPTMAYGNSERRRAINFAKRGSLCPAALSACTVSGSKLGFECINASSNLEQCGGCATDGGVDCTVIEGVEGTACVAGRCEIWSCAQGYRWSARKEVCEA